MGVNRDDIEFYDEWHQSNLSGEAALKLHERQRFLGRLLRGASGPALVVGCGSDDEMKVIPDGVEAIGLDISSVAVRKSSSCFPQHSYIVADAANLPFSSSCGIQTIVCSEVIEHVRNSQQALHEFYRVMEPDGRLYLTTPNWISFYGLARAIGRLFGKDLTSADQPYDHWSTKKSLGAQLEDVGFTSLQWIGLWFFPPFGKGDIRIPDRFVVPFLRLLMPLERKVRRFFPSLGHIIFALSIKKN
ncbi:MAG: class I SAM-dependent methyltransferase [Promethearchaeati archaeon]